MSETPEYEKAAADAVVAEAMHHPEGHGAEEHEEPRADVVEDAVFSVERKPIVAMIHVGALPGTPGHFLSPAEIVDEARREAALYAGAGVKCLMIENMHDVPYLRGRVGPEIVSVMTLVAQAVKAETGLPVGIQILAGADLDALAVAHAAGLDFVRTECFAFAHIADEGLMQSNAAQLLRYRRQIGADEVQIWADLKKKHSSHAITADVSLAEMAEAAQFMGADAVIVTGTSTGRAPRPEDVLLARHACKLPVFAGSGITLENVADFLPHCDGVIVGSALKEDGNWRFSPAPERVRAFMDRVSEVLSHKPEDEVESEPAETAPAPESSPAGNPA